VSVHGITFDSKERLWLIDNGEDAGKPIPPGGTKIVGFDTQSGKILARVLLEAPVLLPDSHINDLRIDLSHSAQDTAFVIDSSFGTSPGLVVADLATGQTRRILAGSHFVAAEAGFVGFLEGKPHVYDPLHLTVPSGGADGITLSVIAPGDYKDASGNRGDAAEGCGISNRIGGAGRVH
jgi:hypothetical protein